MDFNLSNIILVRDFWPLKTEIARFPLEYRLHVFAGPFFEEASRINTKRTGGLDMTVKLLQIPENELQNELAGIKRFQIFQLCWQGLFKK